MIEKWFQFGEPSGFCNAASTGRPANSGGTNWRSRSMTAGSCCSSAERAKKPCTKPESTTLRDE